MEKESILFSFIGKTSDLMGKSGEGSSPCLPRSSPHHHGLRMDRDCRYERFHFHYLLSPKGICSIGNKFFPTLDLKSFCSNLSPATILKFLYIPTDSCPNFMTDKSSSSLKTGRSGWYEICINIYAESNFLRRSRN